MGESLNPSVQGFAIDASDSSDDDGIQCFTAPSVPDGQNSLYENHHDASVVHGIRSSTASSVSYGQNSLYENQHDASVVHGIRSYPASSVSYGQNSLYENHHDASVVHGIRSSRASSVSYGQNSLYENHDDASVVHGIRSSTASSVSYGQNSLFLNDDDASLVNGIPSPTASSVPYGQNSLYANHDDASLVHAIPSSTDFSVSHGQNRFYSNHDDASLVHTIRSPTAHSVSYGQNSLYLNDDGASLVNGIPRPAAPSVSYGQNSLYSNVLRPEAFHVEKSRSLNSRKSRKVSRRRRVVTRSLNLENGFSASHYNAFSDSGMAAPLGYKYAHNSDSSSSDSSVRTIEVPVRKPIKSHRVCAPPAKYSLGNHLPTTNNTGPFVWVPIHSEDIDTLNKVHDLENDKKTLLLQASVLADQVDAQADKIIELERLLQKKKDELMHLEQSLHQEILSRSTVENNKIELLSELTNLQLRLSMAEKEKKDSDEKCQKLQDQLSMLQSHLSEKEVEQKALRDKILLKDCRTTFKEGSEIDKLKSVLDNVHLASDKDQKLEDLHSSLNKYKKIHNMIISNHSHLKKAPSSGSDSYLLNLDESLLCSVNSELLKKIHNESNALKSASVLSSVSSSPIFRGQIRQPSPTPAFTISTSSFNSFQKSNSLENICPINAPYFSKNQYGTMPHQTSSQILHQLQLQENRTADAEDHSLSAREKSMVSDHEKATSSPLSSRNHLSSSNKSSGVSFGKGFFRFRFGKRSSSEPRLADECISIPNDKISPNYSDPDAVRTHAYFIKSDKERNKGLLKFFSRFKRTGSQNIEQEFKRGGIRATAGPRLGWSYENKIDTNVPFIQWNSDMIVDWFYKQGLSMYVGDCKRWMCSGEKLVKATCHDIEKELNMKHPLHRKKLMLAIKHMNSDSSDLSSAINKIDCDWVIRWLDDVGLPQYKDAFSEALVDGRVLNALTVDDLLNLKVTSQLHHASIKCSIQVLRGKGFNPHCLIRRSLPDECKVYTPDMVALWTNHRVMEWLRTVDLSEYAPNLRGSGVHGALIVYESKFNASLFATLLNIPPSKTLLRRHLATHFKHIVGDGLMQVKREKETEIPLSPSLKIKAPKKTQFIIKKKRNKSEFDHEDLICPLDIPVFHDHTNNTAKPSDADKLVVRRNSDPSPQERHTDLKTMLEENNLNCVPSTVV